MNVSLERFILFSLSLYRPYCKLLYFCPFRNMTLRKMPFPVNDAAAALRMVPDRTEAALQKVYIKCSTRYFPIILVHTRSSNMPTGNGNVT